MTTYASARRRRRSPRVAFPADISTLSSGIVAQGAQLAALWDRRTGEFAVSSLLNAWQSYNGPMLLAAGTARPLVNGDGSLNFDGVDDFMRALGGLGLVTGKNAIFMIMKGQTAAAGRASELSNTGVTSINAGAQAAGPVWTTKSLASVAMVANAASPQVLHSRVDPAVGVGTRVGLGAETTAAAVNANSTPDRFTLGANRLDVAASFAPIAGLYAVGIIAGDYTLAIATLVYNWAVANHGAV